MLIEKTNEEKVGHGLPNYISFISYHITFILADWIERKPFVNTKCYKQHDVRFKMSLKGAFCNNN